MHYIFVNHPTISSNFADSKLSKIHTYNLVTYWLCNALFICKPKTKFEGAKIFSMFQSIFLEKHSDSKLIMNYLFRKWLWKNSYHWFLLSWKAIEIKTTQESPNKHKNWQTHQIKKQTEKWQPCVKSQPL